ncbi:UDP-glucose 4-epimerase [Photobacterium phosphoreum]|uniref:UDP-glucose 4-epimerase family protein n=1 Tax=Photobacterium phosphoreum TaxID=659 RepID=UPI000D17B0AE|nr:SDR family oxidoreductase [Photobacterium phosphoreum]PSU64868.1 UDP-glucose 4-epimerase [Photobacterium phosphoreum]PSW06406.1 UDP-glucose 4-epimerase [Photobacterium phosphoreum]
MKIIMTGGSGFVGLRVLNKLKKHDVINFTRNPVSNNDCKYELGNEINSLTIFDSVDVIIHCAARVHIMDDTSTNPLDDYREVNTKGTLNLARQAVEAGVKRFIFISSIKVNGESTQLDKPFKFDDKRSPEDFYGQSKSEAEEQLLQLAEETGLEVVIIRPTLVYGPGVKANFASLLNLVSKGLPLPFGCIKDNKRSLVSVDNLVNLIITCIDHPKAANQVFLVSDDNDVSTSEMVQQMAKALGKSQWQLPIPTACYRLAGRVVGKEDVINRLLGSLQVDITHTKETLGWKPPQTLEDGFKQTADAFLQSKLKD